MSWIEKLYETALNIELAEIAGEKPWPVAHMAKKAHVEIILNHKGDFQDARILNWDESVTIIPTTETSANRTNGIAPHPLCEELGYCAKDLPGRDERRYPEMKKLIEGWLAFSKHPKVAAVYRYLENGSIYSDLNKKQVFPFKSVNFKGAKTPVEEKKVFIRWRVYETDKLCDATWEDSSLIESWIAYESSCYQSDGFCMLQGDRTRIATGHPRFIRSSDDGAKLISSNDNEGYTFKGRFTDTKNDSGKQACSVGFSASQKAHNALRWLIKKQGSRNGSQVFVAWAVPGHEIPDPWANTLDFLGPQGEANELTLSLSGNVGQSFALRLKKIIAGYKSNILDTEDIVVMGLDSATPGRMAITFYRELCGSEFLERIENWHNNYAWFQNFGKEYHFVGAPSPKDIAGAAFGNRVDGSQLNATVERIMPCIVDGAILPNDLLDSCVRRASNRISMEPWEWEKCLGIACSLYKGTNTERGYQMALEEDRKTRDYLYGRLLAIGEQIESMALFYAKEKRDTMAARLMQRFADRPFSTWKTIETALAPYKSRINAKMPGLLSGYQELLDTIHSDIVSADYVSDVRLSGEYLLGYHCQRKWFKEHKREKGQWVLKQPEEAAVAEIESVDEE